MAARPRSAATPLAGGPDLVRYACGANPLPVSFRRSSPCPEPSGRGGSAALARGRGCRAVDVQTTDELEQEFKAALGADTPTVIVVRTQPQVAML